MKKYKEYLVLIIFTMGTQALLYFAIKTFINDYNIITSVINIRLIKPFIYIYDIWYPFVLIVTFLIYKYNKSIFKNLITSMLLGALFAQITFIIYPTMLVRPIVEINSITDWLLNFTYKTDSPAVNCLPSLHCIYCFIIIFFITKCNNINYKKKIFIIIISLLIVISTLFTKQHIIEDIILSLIYTIIAISIVNMNKERINKIFNKLHIS